MPLDRPIFIIGTGRCGSTILHQMFSCHPQIAFLSGLCLLYPDRPEYNRRAMRLLDAPLVGGSGASMCAPTMQSGGGSSRSSSSSSSASRCETA
ncbi:MAG TPA: sulfotransferase [Pirellulales bacterium]|nr:sulfotransferase [Pirellulales bacterium]